MAGGFTTLTNDHLIRTDVWSKQIRQPLMDDLIAMQFVDLITEFPDGNTFHIPSLGEAETLDFSEGQAVKYNKLDTGEFTFSFDQYKYSAHSISEKFKRDSMWSSDVIAAFPTREHRALMEAVEVRILSRGNAAQTASDLNLINGAAHRWVGSGTNETIAFKDFALARHALRMANVPLTNLVAIVDPSVTYAIQTNSAVVGLLSPDPQWQEVVKRGMVTGLRFMFNLYGFDVYESNYLPKSIAETINAKSVTVGVANQFFSAAPSLKPYIGGFKQMPTVYQEFNKDLQQTEYLTIAEYGFKQRHIFNMVNVLTDTDQVA